MNSNSDIDRIISTSESPYSCMDWINVDITVKKKKKEIGVVSICLTFVALYLIKVIRSDYGICWLGGVWTQCVHVCMRYNSCGYMENFQNKQFNEIMCVIAHLILGLEEDLL